MKSDKVHHRSKDRVKDIRISHYGETWPVADLCALAPGEIQDTKDLLMNALAQLRQSGAVRLMIREAAEQGWRLGLSHLDEHDFHLDVPDRLIVLNNNGFDAAGLMRSQYFYNGLQISLIRALRDAWQEKRHGGFDENYTPESVLFLERIRAADCDVITILAAWELRSEGEENLWRHILGSDESDIAQAFARTLEKDTHTDQTHKALSAAFKQWFQGNSRVNTCDHETLEYMDDVLDTNPGVHAFGKKRAGRACVEILSCLPDKTAYLRGQGEDILRDPVYAGLCELLNQSHFMHVLRDAQVVYVQNVPFRDARLAAKIFPGGGMTPEREEIIQKS